MESANAVQESSNRSSASEPRSGRALSLDRGSFQRVVRCSGLWWTGSSSFRIAAGDSGDWRNASMSFVRGTDFELPEEIESEIVARAGDSGRRDVLQSADDSLLQFKGFWYEDAADGNNRPPVSPLQSDIVSPLSTDVMLGSRDANQNASQQQQDNSKKFLLYISCLIHLAFFGILGVFLRYLLQKLFGPSTIGLTSDATVLYLDLPSNMVGSFLMGWLGINYRGKISRFSEELAIGLTTGFLGSLTTFSGWNQKMLELASEGRWALVAFGYLIDMLLIVSCIYVGVGSTRDLRWPFKCLSTCNTGSWKVEYRSWTAILMLVIWLVILAISIALLKTGLESEKTSTQLWLACIVGPPGVWLRWFLAGYNGRGFGRARLMKWVPLGTLAANVLAALLMASLATIKKVVSTKRCDIIIDGIQLGFPGCLSTVSTFVAEIYAMSKSNHPERALAYTMITILLSFILGILVYSVPVWAKGY